ncbi:MAG: hypothetical protein M3P08_17645 [Thermoproteota archaeon]|nr:hypothetical protein [Thermoproteota archaeon]
MTQIGRPLESLFDIHEGLITGCNKADKRFLEQITARDISKHSISAGSGVFVLNKKELDALGLSKYEEKWVKPFYKNSDIHRYWIDLANCEYLLYLTRDIAENMIPNIIFHLAGELANAKFKPGLESRKEFKQKKDPWFALHRPREMDVFEEEKIVFPYRKNQPFYGASDMYFITKKPQITGSMNLKYLLGILNSSLFRFWFRHRANVKDGKQEMFANRMGSFPVIEINPSDKIHTAHQDRIVKLVSDILAAIQKLHELQKFYSEPLFDFYGIPKKPSLCKLNANYVIKSLPNNATRKFRSSELLHVNTGKGDFNIQSLSDIQYNLHAKKHILVRGDEKNVASIEGDKDSLLLITEILGAFIGQEFKATLDDILFPVDIRSYYNIRENIIHKHMILYKDIVRNQRQIDIIVSSLYGIEPSEII